VDHPGDLIAYGPVRVVAQRAPGAGSKTGRLPASYDGLRKVCPGKVLATVTAGGVSSFAPAA
jgi:hypothetical protein